jgi:hypothetical protein
MISPSDAPSPDPPAAAVREPANDQAPPPRPHEEFSPDSGPVTSTEIASQLGSEVVGDLLRLGRHHTAPDGTPFWPGDQVDDLIDLVRLERREV